MSPARYRPRRCLAEGGDHPWTGHDALPRRIHGQRRRAALLLEIAQDALPPGLSIDSPTGQVTGTPTIAGTFSFWARVTDSDETQFFVDSMQSIMILS